MCVRVSVSVSVCVCDGIEVVCVCMYVLGERVRTRRLLGRERETDQHCALHHPRACCCVSGFGFRVSGFGFRASGIEIRVSGFGSRVSSVGFRISGLGFGVWSLGFGFRGSSLGFGVWDFGLRVSVHEGSRHGRSGWSVGTTAILPRIQMRRLVGCARRALQLLPHISNCMAMPDEDPPVWLRRACLYSLGSGVIAM